MAKSILFEPVESELLDENGHFKKGLPTEDDLPCSDGEPMETGFHVEQMYILIKSLRAYWKNSKRYYIWGNMFLHYMLNTKKQFRGTDVFLVMDVEDRFRKSYVVWQEGKYPDLIIELLSETTKKVDMYDKKIRYEKQFKTQEYFLYDVEGYEFYGYKLVSGQYEKLMPDEDNKIYSGVTDLYLIVHDGWLRWMTKDWHILPTPIELAEQTQEMVEYVQQRADTEKQRAEQVKQELEQERQRATEAEKLIEEYRRRFGAL